MQDTDLSAVVSSFARRYPDRAAIRTEDRAVSYSRLDHQINLIAESLRREPVENPYILVLLDRSPEIIQAILGILKAGLVFVPVSPKFPGQRVSLLLAETGARRVITSSLYYQRFQSVFQKHDPPIRVLFTDEWQDEAPTPGGKPGGGDFLSIYNNRCYVYFTSGSTGKPKGILGNHRGLLHFIQWEIEEFGITPGFNVSQLTTPTFDPYLRDIFVPLLSGGTCCIPSYDTLLDPVRLIRWIDDNQIRLIHIVPSLFKALAAAVKDSQCLQSVKTILLAGELLRGNDIRRFMEMFGERIQLVNIYGPTETTLAKFFYRLAPGDENRSVIPVGKTIPGAQAMVFDHLTRKRCRVGKVGEVLIRTPYRSYGYLNDAGLNREYFITNPFTGDAKDIVYKTGDLGRMLPDNNIELVGRIGQQLKIRGHRIEPGEIESQLLKLPEIEEAVVLALKDPDGEPYLCAYLLPRDTAAYILDTPEVVRIKDHLLAILPDYMVPAFYVKPDHIPLNINGKIDRGALAEMQVTRVSGSQYVAPRDKVEKGMVEIWTAILAVGDNVGDNKIGLESNFFDLGGHSLKAIDLAVKIRKIFNVKIPLSEIFAFQKLGKMADYVKNAFPAAQYAAVFPVEKKEYYELSSAQKRLYFMQQVNLESAAYNVFRTFNMQPGTQPEKLDRAFRQMVRRHESLRTSFAVVHRHPVQCIHDTVDFSLQLYESRSDSETGAIVEAFNLPFDLSNAPLLKAGLIDRGGRGYLLMVSIHHIITDAVSNGILMKDLAALYNNDEPPPLTLQYKDYSEWQNRMMESGGLKMQERYWLDHLAGELPVLDIPTDFPRPGKRYFDGASTLFKPDKTLAHQLNRVAAGQNATLAMVLLTAYFTLLFKLRGQEDIIVGSPITGRGHRGLNQVIGMLVNILPLRGRPGENKSFLDFLKEVKDTALDAYENQDYPFERLAAKLGKQGISNRNPIFDAVFEFITFDPDPRREQPPEPAKTSTNSNSEPLPAFRVENRLSPFDMILAVFETQNGLHFNFTYSTRLFKASTAQQFTSQYLQVLKQVVEDNSRKLGDFSTDLHLIAADTAMFEDDQLEFEF
jgi:amino acid adenylation domain-containing protein